MIAGLRGMDSLQRVFPGGADAVLPVETVGGDESQPEGAGQAELFVLFLNVDFAVEQQMEVVLAGGLGVAVVVVPAILIRAFQPSGSGM